MRDVVPLVFILPKYFPFNESLMGMGHRLSSTTEQTRVCAMVELGKAVLAGV